jgi:tetratricopeptide (TPR) repeat protein
MEEPVTNGFRAELHKPYISLERGNVESFFGSGAVLTAELMASQDMPKPFWAQRQMPPSFREELAAELPFMSIAVSTPHETPISLRTPLWQALCDASTNWRDLTQSQRTHVARALINLGFYEYVLALHDILISSKVHLSPRERLQCEIAKVRIMRASSDKRFLPRDLAAGLRDVAKTFSPSDVEFFVCCLSLLLLSLTELKDIDQAKLWATQGQRSAETIASAQAGPFVSGLLRSCWLRAFAMIPHAEGKLSDMKAIMNECEVTAEALCGADRAEQFLQRENLYSVYESAAKSSLVVNELETARVYLQKLNHFFPNDAKALITYGEFLMSTGDFAGAAAAYRRAGNCGPVGTAMAWFMAGQAYEHLDELPAAMECYSRSLKSDSLAISALDGLGGVASKLGIPIEANVAKLRDALAELIEAEEQYA